MENRVRGIPSEVIRERKLETRLEKPEYKGISDFSITYLPGAGYVLESKGRPTKPTRATFSFDYDDTMVGTTEVKAQRQQDYIDYARSLHIGLSDKQLGQLVNTTDTFSRWKEGQGEFYFANAHIAVLSWATDKLQGAQGDSEAERGILSNIYGTIARIKTQIDNPEQKSQPEDPFSFQAETKRFFARGDIPWSKGIENIFKAKKNTMLNPPFYEETLQAIEMLREDDVNINIFTYGLPEYQLIKLLELFNKRPALRVNSIFLTEIPKGEFLKILEEYQRQEAEGQVRVVFDDSRAEAEDLSNRSDVVVVRSVRKGTKEERREWKAEPPHSSVDFTKEDTANVVNELQRARYRGTVQKFGPSHSKTVALAKSLQAQGITLDNLATAA